MTQSERESDGIPYNPAPSWRAYRASQDRRILAEEIASCPLGDEGTQDYFLSLALSEGDFATAHCPRKKYPELAAYLHRCEADHTGRRT